MLLYLCNNNINIINYWKKKREYESELWSMNEKKIVYSILINNLKFNHKKYFDLLFYTMHIKQQNIYKECAFCFIKYYYYNKLVFQIID